MIRILSPDLRYVRRMIGDRPLHILERRHHQRWFRVFSGISRRSALEAWRDWRAYERECEKLMADLYAGKLPPMMVLNRL